MTVDDTVHWDEEEYCRYLNAERRGYAWVLSESGGLTPGAARAAALTQYPYERADQAQRGQVFHDEAWHRAMLRLHGELYWRTRPELLHPPVDYESVWDSGYAQDPATAIPIA